MKIRVFINDEDSEGYDAKALCDDLFLLYVENVLKSIKDRINRLESLRYSAVEDMVDVYDSGDNEEAMKYIKKIVDYNYLLIDYIKFIRSK